MAAADRIMFEIYREAAYGRRYRVVYFTELDEHNKDLEIDRALAGDHFYDGFIPGDRNDQAKQVIAQVIERLNEGEAVAATELEQALATCGA